MDLVVITLCAQFDKGINQAIMLLPFYHWDKIIE